jgi:hypothetical protein
MPAAARQNDKAQHDSPHCHAAIHPPSPTPTPAAHPPVPFALVSATTTTVKIDNLNAAVVGTLTKQCQLASCVPAGPGVISKGSSTVMFESRPAARADDIVSWSGCSAPIPSPTGKVLPPCSPTVVIGG